MAKRSPDFRGAMNLYLDDNSVKASLENLLRCAGHQVTRPVDLELAGASDPRHLASCAPHGLVLLTRDHDDYLDLHDLVQATHGRHAGILVVRADNDPARDMRDRDIVRSIANLKAARIPIENEFYILNHWR
jgi:predicted nuclease of predicted toxin-antitoxin system